MRKPTRPKELNKVRLIYKLGKTLSDNAFKTRYSTRVPLYQYVQVDELVSSGYHLAEYLFRLTSIQIVSLLFFEFCWMKWHEWFSSTVCAHKEGMTVVGACSTFNFYPFWHQYVKVSFLTEKKIIIYIYIYLFISNSDVLH